MNAQSSKSTRRNLLTIGAAVALTGIASVSMASAGERPSIGHDFAAKCRKFRELRAALDALYKSTHKALDTLGEPEPEPPELREPLAIPGKGKAAPPDGRGWRTEELKELIDQDKRLVFTASHLSDGRMSLRSSLRPIPQKTKARAAELLTVRAAYNVTFTKWVAKARKIENLTAKPIRDMDWAFHDVMKHPAANVREMLMKVQVAREADVFNDLMGDCPLRNHTIKSLVSDIERLALQA